MSLRVFRFLGLAGNGLGLLVAVLILIDRADHMRDPEAALMLLAVPTLCLNLYYFAFKAATEGEPGVIRLWIRRKALEEKQRIKALEQQAK